MRDGQATPSKDMSGVDVVYFAAIDWSFRLQHHQYLSLEMERHGARVIFVENTGVRWPRLRDIGRVIDRLARALRSAPSSGLSTESGLTVLTPYVLPVSRARALRRLNRALLRWQVDRALGTTSRRRLVAWIGLPNWTSLDTSRALGPATVVYYCADEFSRVPGAHPSIRESEPEVFRGADVVFATSGRLAKLAATHGVTATVVPVGVETAAFAQDRDAVPRPLPLATCRGRIIGYMGGLNHKVDVPLLDEIARAFPNDTLVVLGPVEDPRDRVAAAPNVRILGSRPHAEVPAFLAHFDVCLIPYRLTDFTASVYPAKLNEYLAAGRPVVSTALPEVMPFADVVDIAQEHERFVALVARALERPDTAQARAARRRVARRSDYAVIANEMLAAVIGRAPNMTAAV